MKYALIDMGSNSIRLTVYDIDQKNFKILFKEKIMAGLAGYVENGRLSKDGINCACQGLLEFQHTLNLLHIDNLAVFATASLRNVSNTDEAVKQIRLTTGISVDVLSGEQEAEFGFYGVSNDVHIKNGLYADIGGASTELVLFINNSPQTSVSVPVGSLKLYREWVKKILPGKESQSQIKQAIDKAFNSSDLKNIPTQKHMVCVGGTARAALRMCKKLYSLPEDCQCFTKKHLSGLTRILCKGNKTAADLILRYEPERVHTLVPGILILHFLMEKYEIEDVTVSQYGVREGYLCRIIQPSIPAVF